MPVRFLARRWSGDVPLARLLWHDMLAVATIVNLLASFLALALIASDGSAGLAVVLHFAPLPYNAFLLAALLRHPAASSTTSTIGAVWFLLVTVL